MRGLGLGLGIGVQFGKIGGVSAPVNTVLPAITGDDPPQVGSPQICGTGSWSPTPDSFTYQWYYWIDESSQFSIGGATSATYVPVSDDNGQQLSCRVTAHKGGATASAMSLPTNAVELIPLSGMLMWAKGNNTSGADNSTITTVPDASGASNNLIVLSGAAKLRTGTSGVLGNSIMRFTPGDVLKCVGLTANQPTTIYVTLKQTNLGTTQVVFDGSTGREALFISGSDEGLIYAGSFPGGSLGTIGSAWHVWAIIFDGVSSQFWIDGVSQAIGDAGANNLVGLLVGQDQGAGNFLNADIEELCIYEGHHSNTTRHGIQNYLATQCGATIAPEYVTIAVTNSALLAGLSPYNWEIDSSYLKSVNPGAYIKVKFAGTSCAFIFDNTTLALSPDNYPQLKYRIDGGSWTTVQMAGVDVATIMSLTSGLTSAVHDLEFILLSNAAYEEALWGGQGGIKLVGVRLDIDATLSAATLRSGRMLVFADSIGKGAFSLAAPMGIPPTNDSLACDATVSWARYLADSYNCEYGNCSFSGQSWETPFNGDVPALPDTFDKVNFGHARDFTGVTRVHINMGSNGGLTNVLVLVNFLGALRAAIGSSAVVELTVPFVGTGRVNITAGYNTYLAANPTDHITLIDLGATGESITATESTDSLHLTPTGHASVGPLILRP